MGASGCSWRVRRAGRVLAAGAEGALLGPDSAGRVRTRLHSGMPCGARGVREPTSTPTNWAQTQFQCLSSFTSASLRPNFMPRRKLPALRV